MADSVVRITDLTAGYRRQQVLQGLSWEFGPGRVGLLGPNGAGKTTLIRCLVGLMVPSAGSIRIGAPGHNTSETQNAAEIQREIGYVPQRAALPGSMTVRQIVEYHAWLKAVPSAKLESTGEFAIATLELSDLADRRAKSLSGGQAQRVAIAAALAHSPSVLVLDEPTAGLDPSHRLALRRAIKALDSVTTILISTHLIEDVEYLCPDVGVLSGGRLRFAGPVADLLSRAATTTESDDGSRFELAYTSLVEDQ